MIYVIPDLLKISKSSSENHLNLLGYIDAYGAPLVV